MKGSPLLRLALVISGLSVLLLPLRSLTAHRPARNGPPENEIAGNLQTVRIALLSTKAPFRFEISHLGKSVWSGEATTDKVESTIEMPFPPEGVDLLLDVSWPEGGPAALKVIFTPGGTEAMTRILWGAGKVSEVVTFK